MDAATILKHLQKKIDQEMPLTAKERAFYNQEMTKLLMKATQENLAARMPGVKIEFK